MLLQPLANLLTMKLLMNFITSQLFMKIKETFTDLIIEISLEVKDISKFQVDFQLVQLLLYSFLMLLEDQLLKEWIPE